MRITRTKDPEDPKLPYFGKKRKGNVSSELRTVGVCIHGYGMKLESRICEV